MHRMHRRGWPAREEAEALFAAAQRRHGGDYARHSRNVAEAAMRIGEKAGLDAEKAFALGLLHDIGRSMGWTGERHMYDGYRMLEAEGYTDAARVCITHGFMVQDIESAIGKWDTTDAEKAFMDKVLRESVYDDYDRLIQLCDAIGDKDGFCIMEMRFVDVALRYGLHASTLERWKKTIEIKKYFDGLCGCSIYSLLPGVEACIMR